MPRSDTCPVAWAGRKTRTMVGRPIKGAMARHESTAHLPMRVFSVNLFRHVFRHVALSYSPAGTVVTDESCPVSGSSTCP